MSEPEEVTVPVELMGQRPSYRYKLEELRRRHAGLKALGVKDPVEAINDKYRAYEFADRHGIDHPRVYGSYESVDQVLWDDLPEKFVLKSRYGSSNHGVKALVRDEGGRFHDLLRSRTWTIDEIVDHQRELEEEGSVSRTLFAEELIVLPGEMKIADDWKFYTFYGVVGLCMQRDVWASPHLGDWKFKFWDPEWKDMGTVKYADRIDPHLLPPRDPEGLSAFAARVSELIRRPFMRIDVFEADRGPVLGEFTPRPGPPELFTPEVDESLGRLWEEAEHRRTAEDIRDGRWGHILGS
jgi:hypothetical protein